MALFRVAAAAGLLLVLAPEETTRVARGLLGLAEEAKSLHAPAAETAIQYCRANPLVCADVARQASGMVAAPAAKSTKP